MDIFAVENVEWFLIGSGDDNVITTFGMDGDVTGGGDRIVADGYTVGVADENTGFSVVAFDDVVFNSDVEDTTPFRFVGVRFDNNAARFSPCCGAVNDMVTTDGDVRRTDTFIPPCFRRRNDGRSHDVAEGTIFDECTAVFEEDTASKVTGSGTTDKFDVRKTCDIGHDKVFCIVGERSIEGDFAHPFVVHGYAGGNGIVTDGLEGLTVSQLEDVADIGIVEGLGVGSVRGLFLEGVSVPFLFCDDHLIIAVDVCEVVSLTVERTIFETKQSLHGGEMGRVGVGGHMMPGGRNDGKVFYDNVFASVADDPHAGLAVNGDVGETDVFCVFDEDRRAGVEGMDGIEKISVTEIGGIAVENGFDMMRIKEGVFLETGVDIAFFLKVVENIAEHHRGMFADGAVLVKFNDTFAATVFVRRLKILESSAAVGFTEVVDGDSLNFDVGTMDEGYRFHKSFDHEECAFGDHTGSLLTVEGDTTGILVFGIEHDSLGISAPFPGHNGIHGVFREIAGNVIDSRRNNQGCTGVFTKIVHGGGKSFDVGCRGKFG